VEKRRLRKKTDAREGGWRVGAKVARVRNSYSIPRVYNINILYIYIYIYIYTCRTNYINYHNKTFVRTEQICIHVKQIL
jgi:hypothetical protein